MHTNTYIFLVLIRPTLNLYRLVVIIPIRFACGKGVDEKPSHCKLKLLLYGDTGFSQYLACVNRRESMAPKQKSSKIWAFSVSKSK